MWVPDLGGIAEAQNVYSLSVNLRSLFCVCRVGASLSWRQVVLSVDSLWSCVSVKRGGKWGFLDDALGDTRPHSGSKWGRVWPSWCLLAWPTVSLVTSLFLSREYPCSSIFCPLFILWQDEWMEPGVGLRSNVWPTPGGGSWSDAVAVNSRL